MNRPRTSPSVVQHPLVQYSVIPGCTAESKPLARPATAGLSRKRLQNKRWIRNTPSVFKGRSRTRPLSGSPSRIHARLLEQQRRQEGQSECRPRMDHGSKFIPRVDEFDADFVQRPNTSSGIPAAIKALSGHPESLLAHSAGRQRERTATQRSRRSRKPKLGASRSVPVIGRLGSTRNDDEELARRLRRLQRIDARHKAAQITAGLVPHCDNSEDSGPLVKKSSKCKFLPNRVSSCSPEVTSSISKKAELHTTSVSADQVCRDIENKFVDEKVGRKACISKYFTQQPTESFTAFAEDTTRARSSSVCSEKISRHASESLVLLVPSVYSAGGVEYPQATPMLPKEPFVDSVKLVEGDLAEIPIENGIPVEAMMTAWHKAPAALRVDGSSNEVVSEATSTLAAESDDTTTALVRTESNEKIIIPNSACDSGETVTPTPGLLSLNPNASATIALESAAIAHESSEDARNSNIIHVHVQWVFLRSESEILPLTGDIGSRITAHGSIVSLAGSERSGDAGNVGSSKVGVHGDHSDYFHPHATPGLFCAGSSRHVQDTEFDVNMCTEVGEKEGALLQMLYARLTEFSAGLLEGDDQRQSSKSHNLPLHQLRSIDARDQIDGLWGPVSCEKDLRGAVKSGTLFLRCTLIAAAPDVSPSLIIGDATPSSEAGRVSVAGSAHVDSTVSYTATWTPSMNGSANGSVISNSETFSAVDSTDRSGFHYHSKLRHPANIPSEDVSSHLARYGLRVSTLSSRSANHVIEAMMARPLTAGDENAEMHALRSYARACSTVLVNSHQNATVFSRSSNYPIESEDCQTKIRVVSARELQAKLHSNGRSKFPRTLNTHDCLRPSPVWKSRSSERRKDAQIGRGTYVKTGLSASKAPRRLSAQEEHLSVKPPPWQFRSSFSRQLQQVSVKNTMGSRDRQYACSGHVLNHHADLVMQFACAGLG